ncbi:MAG: HDOD domain-containing protein [Pirellulaceae bacterium]
MALTRRFSPTYWQFTLFKSLAADRLATHLVGPEEAAIVFSAAMSHDVGMLAMLQQLGTLSENFISHIIGEPSSKVLKKEANTLGFDHRVLGAKMLVEWQFPEEIVDLAKLRSDPKKS